MPPPLKVLLVMPLADRQGGAENIIWDYLRGVDRERIEPAVVFFDDGPFREEVAGLGMATYVARPGDSPRPRILRFPPRLVRIIRREQPGLILSCLVEAQPFAAVAGLLTGRRRHVAWWQANLPRADMWERISTALPSRAVFTHSHAVAAVQRTIWPHRRTIVVHPGIEELPSASVDELAALRAELALPPDRPVLGIVGRLMTWKGQHHVLRAIALLRDRGRDVHGLIVGGDAHGFEPEYEPALHRLARELDIEDRVTFTGQVPNGARYMQLMDVVLNASDAEPFGIVVLEGMALRVPVVAVDNAGPAEIIEHGVSGLLVPAATPEHFAHACERLVDSPEERVRLAEGGRARYLERFTRVRMVGELTDALEELGARAGQARAA